MKKFDVMIIGGGLAGLSAAAHLIEKDSKLNILIYDATKIGDAASGVPGGLVNPVTGQKARVVWQAETSIKQIEKRVDLLSDFADLHLSLKNGVLRPAIDETLAANLKRAHSEKSWPGGKQWLSSSEVAQRIPYLTSTTGGLFLNKGMVVRTPEYMDCYTRYLKDKEIKFAFGGPYKLYHEDHWILDNRKAKFSSPQVVITSGYKTKENRYWCQIPMNSVKGQLAIYHCDTVVDRLPAISAYGYIAPVDRNQLVVGSTYEHHFHDEKPDGQSAGLLDRKLKELLPGLYGKCRRIGLWSGIRATTPDRMPIVGEHPNHKGMFVFTGLGSKGLLYSEQVAGYLANHLLSRDHLPDEISLMRFASFAERDCEDQD